MEFFSFKNASQRSVWARRMGLHKSSWRHGRHIQTAFSTGVISSIIPRVFFCTLISVLVTIFNHAVMEGVLPHWVPSLRVPTLPMSLTAPVLSLLLVFRTNSSYNRLDEARKAWGSNVNRTRDVSRQALSWICDPDDADKLQSLLRHIKAFSYCLKDHLTQENLLQEELARVLEPREVELVLKSSHRPNYVLHVMSDTIKHCRISKWESKSMDRNITQFHDNVGACERLFKTPIPVAYTRMISRFLSIWHFLLPLALWNSCRWLTIPVTFVSGVGLFCIEEVGVLIEDPSTSLLCCQSAMAFPQLWMASARLMKEL